MTMHPDQRPRPIDIRLDALSENEWRVCDDRLAADDHLSILGFIEMRNGQFEVTTMAAPGERRIAVSLQEAKASFALTEHTRVPTANLVV